MTTYWRTIMSNGKQSVVLYAETYDDAVLFDLTMGGHSLIRSSHGSMPGTMELCSKVLAEAAFATHARNAGFSAHLWDIETVLAIPRCLQAFGVGGNTDTCAVVVFQRPLVLPCAEVEDGGQREIPE